MTDLRTRIRNAIDTAPPVSLAEVQDRRHRRRARTAVIAATLVAACALILIVAIVRPGRLTSVTVAGHPTTSVRSTGPTATRVQASSITRNGVTVRLILHTDRGSSPSDLKTLTILQGQSIRGTFTVSNRRAVRGCAGIFYALTLTSRATGPVGSGFTSPACNRVALRPGTHSYSVTAQSIYQACSQRRGEATPRLPACLPGGGLPNLPAGLYGVTLEYDLPLPSPPDIPIRLIGGRQ